MVLGLKRIRNLFKNNIELPKGLGPSGEYKVLHLSDTPSSIYPAIMNMLGELKPDLIIHTGDIADDLKLEGNPRCLGLYHRTVGPFLEGLARSAPGLYIVPGNHDSLTFIKSKVSEGNVVKPGVKMDIGGYSFGMAHTVSDLPEGAQYNLFGHNFDEPENTTERTYLNGVKNINVILLPSGKVFGLDYPGGTDRCRRYWNSPPKLI